MKILVLNVGSSSLKFGVFDLRLTDSRVFKAEFNTFTPTGCLLHYRMGAARGVDQSRADSASDLRAALRQVAVVLQEFGYAQVDAVGHRVPHGGSCFTQPVRIDETVIAQIQAFSPLAPLHNPLSLEGIAIARSVWPDLPHVAVFDTAFHATMPDQASTYAVPLAWRQRGLRRYGFHGTSHRYVALRAAQEFGRPLSELQLISCHLGNGASVCAINHGASVDTSMGMTPLEGLVMGTRSGDVDPGVFTWVHRELGLTPEQVEQQLYEQGGLKALAGCSDMREIELRAAEADVDAQLAIRVFVYRVRKYIGAYAAAMGGVDAIIFTGGIGENSASMRRRICDQFEFIGMHLDHEQNETLRLSGFQAQQIHRFDSQIRILVTQACEQFMIAHDVASLLREPAVAQRSEHTIPVSVSARHVHLCQRDIDSLFGKGHVLKKLHNLKQPDGWAAEETVDISGPHGSLHSVRVLGPVRDRTQIEISKTDTFVIGVDAPVRASGHLQGTPRVRLAGPVGEIETNGLIVAARHIHMSPHDAAQLNLSDGDLVDVAVGQGERAVALNNALIRIKDTYVTEMHIDTDEANAAGISSVSSAGLLVTQPAPHATIVRQRACGSYFPGG